MSELAKKRCIPCEEGGPPLNFLQANALLKELNEWMLIDEAHVLVKEFQFKDFADGLAFVDKVGAIAEEEGHHPDITLSWGNVGIELSTHSIGGLSENDFILASKIDQIKN